jgi:REP element-mobilizing transposase RayT
VPKAFYRRQLPHLQRHGKPHFLTFCTNQRWILPEGIRSIVLECCLHDEGIKTNIQVVVVMPDHVHMIFTPLVNQRAMEVYSLAEITDAIKGASAHKVNQAMERHGQVWQPESFDHVLRSSESLLHKVQYVLENPLRQGLAAGGKVIPGSGRSRSSTLMLYRLRVLTQAGH